MLALIKNLSGTFIAIGIFKDGRSVEVLKFALAETEFLLLSPSHLPAVWQCSQSVGSSHRLSLMSGDAYSVSGGFWQIPQGPGPGPSSCKMVTLVFQISRSPSSLGQLSGVTSCILG